MVITPTGFPGFWAIIPALGAALVIGAGSGPMVNHALATRTMVGVGLISYPLYLWHWPLLVTLRSLDVAGSGTYRFAAIALSFVLAAATYLSVEKAVRSRPSPAYALRLILVLASIIPASYAFSYVAARQVDVADNPFVQWQGWNTKGCAEKYGLDGRLLPFCVEVNPDKPISIMVIGDSMANQWIPGIAKANPDAGILNIGAGNCAFLDGVGTESPLDDQDHRALCRTVMTRAFEVVRQHPSIKSVVLSTKLVKIIAGLNYQGISEAPGRHLISNVVSGNDNEKIFSYHLKKTLTELAAQGKHIYIITPPPELMKEPSLCIRARLIDAFRPLSTCRVDRTFVERWWAPFLNILDEEAKEFTNLTIINTANTFCNLQCPETKDGKVLYRNIDHLSVVGSEYAWPRLVGLPPGGVLAR